MVTRFALVRHARCALTGRVLMGRLLDPALDGAGRSQARALARQLAGESPARIECSPRLRTRQTAEAIAAAARCRLHEAAALDEVDYGAWSGRTFGDLATDPAWREWNVHRDSGCTPAGETMAALQRRVLAYLDVLAQASPGATLVLVTHAEPIRAAILHARGLPFDAYAAVDVAPASVTRLRLDRDGLHIDPAGRPA